MGACEDDDSDDEAMPYLIPVYPKQVEFTVQVSGDVVQANVAGARPPQSSTEPSLEEAAAGALWRDTTAADAPREPMKICWKAKEGRGTRSSRAGRAIRTGRAGCRTPGPSARRVPCRSRCRTAPTPTRRSSDTRSGRKR
ncbi:unnamed protein product [Prorocentrum cordatum]|uniref:Uncharacterized protein n=1 Tax=Prorocentrum cordatum TaxID=2364126 RepID=A0ABN9TZX4_9DINO|nr:unnamed protein product [Polarella glacialis]